MGTGSGPTLPNPPLPYFAERPEVFLDHYAAIFMNIRAVGRHRIELSTMATPETVDRVRAHIQRRLLAGLSLTPGNDVTLDFRWTYRDDPQASPNGFLVVLTVAFRRPRRC